MRKITGDCWEGSFPKTNVLWLTYLVDTLLTKKSFTGTSKDEKELRLFRKHLHSYDSAKECLSYSFFNEAMNVNEKDNSFLENSASEEEFNSEDSFPSNGLSLREKQKNSVLGRRKPHSQARDNKMKMIKKCDNNINDDRVVVSNPPIYSSSNGGVNEDLVVEILSRLPVKTLTRFKCVSKHLCFVIEKDQYFIDLHLTHSKMLPRLFIVIMQTDKINFVTADFLESGVSAETATIHTIEKSHDYDHVRFLKPINGLMCFHNYNVARIYNVSTRELTPWIIPPGTKELRGYNPCDWKDFYFGFDPSTRRHKVICFEFKPFYTVCKILTVGQNIWRNMDEDIPQSSDLMGGSIYVNGSIYWIKLLPFCRYRYDYFLVAFDVGNEKFRKIQIPSFISGHPRDWHEGEIKNVQLLEVDDSRVAILDRINDSVVKLWILDDHYNPHNNNNENIITTTTNTTSSSTSNEKWTEETIILPFCRDEFFRIEVHSAQGIRDHIMIEAYKTCGQLSYYLYNWKKKTTIGFEISEIPPLVPEKRPSLFATFSENLLSSQEMQSPSH